MAEMAETAVMVVKAAMVVKVAQQYVVRHMKRLQLLLPRYLAALAVPVEMVEPADPEEQPERKETVDF